MGGYTDLLESRQTWRESSHDFEVDRDMQVAVNKRLREELGSLSRSFEIAKSEAYAGGLRGLVTFADIQNFTNRILERPIEWIDMQAMPMEVRTAMSAEARAVLENRAFQSLCGKMGPERTNGELVKTLIEHIARYAITEQEMMNMRMTINGIELIRGYLEAMLVPKAEESRDDLNASI